MPFLTSVFAGFGQFEQIKLSSIIEKVYETCWNNSEVLATESSSGLISTQCSFCNLTSVVPRSLQFCEPASQELGSHFLLLVWETRILEAHTEWSPWEIGLSTSKLNFNLKFTYQSLFLVSVGCLMRWGCNLIKLEPWYLYNWPLHSICKSVIFSTKKFSYTII